MCSIQLSYGRSGGALARIARPGNRDTVRGMTDSTLHAIDAATAEQRGFRLYDVMMAAFVAILLLSNVIGAGKVATLHGFTFGAGILFFPISYVLGDVLTEVYGYARARRCIWAGFAAVLFMAFMAWVVVALPPAPGWTNQPAYEAVFGQGVDSLIFYPLAFWGAGGWTHALVLTVMVTNWAMKVGWEVLLTPFTYAVVGFLKRVEGVDVFDRDTNFSPFGRRG